MYRILFTSFLLLIGGSLFAQRPAKPDTLRRKGGITIVSNANYVTILSGGTHVSVSNDGGVKIESSHSIDINTTGDLNLSAENIHLNASRDIEIIAAGGDLSTQALNTIINSSISTEVSGMAGLELNSSAVVVVQGALIQIGKTDLKPAARLSDIIVPDTNQPGQNMVGSGSPTVLIGY